MLYELTSGIRHITDYPPKKFGTYARCYCRTVAPPPRLRWPLGKVVLLYCRALILAGRRNGFLYNTSWPEYELFCRKGYYEMQVVGDLKWGPKNRGLHVWDEANIGQVARKGWKVKRINCTQTDLFWSTRLLKDMQIQNIPHTTGARARDHTLLFFF